MGIRMPKVLEESGESKDVQVKVLAVVSTASLESPEAPVDYIDVVEPVASLVRGVSDERTEAAKRQILAYLKANAVGKGGAIEARLLVQEVGMDEKSHNRFRAILTDMLRDGELVGSCPQGFFLIATEDEFNDCVGALQSRIDGIAGRIHCLKSAWSQKTRADAIRQEKESPRPKGGKHKNRDRNR